MDRFEDDELNMMYNNPGKFNEKMRERINDKITTFCKEYETKYGLLSYKKIEHNFNGLYENLDILSKKKLLNDLNNTVILTEQPFGHIVTLIHKNIDTNALLLRNDDKTISMGTRSTLTFAQFRNVFKPESNKLLNKDAIWFKFYNKDNKEIDFINDVKDTYMINLYMENIIIIHSLINGLPLPYVDFNNEKMIRVTLERLRLLLDFKEASCLCTLLN